MTPPTYPGSESPMSRRRGVLPDRLAVPVREQKKKGKPNIAAIKSKAAANRRKRKLKILQRNLQRARSRTYRRR